MEPRFIHLCVLWYGRQKLKRHQVSRACQPCAKAKRKCDGQRPVSFILQDGLHVVAGNGSLVFRL